PVYAAQPYNSGAYDDCAYSVGCDPAAPATVVPVPPSTDNPQPGRAFSVNISDNQEFNGNIFTVIVTPNFSVDQIKSVEFYQNDQLIGTVYSPDGGIYKVKWDLPQKGGYTVKVIMNLKDGSTIEKTFKISVVNDRKSISTSQGLTGDSASSNPSGRSAPESFMSRLFAPATSFLKQIAQSTPKPLAYAMPYIVLVLLGLLLLSLVYQTRNQLVYIAALLKLLERDKQLAEEKANFIMLASHYIRTPLTILSGNIEMALMAHAGDVMLLQSQASTDALHKHAEQVLDDVQQNKDLLSIRSPDIKTTRSNLYHSFSLIGPIALSAILIIGINVLYISARRINLIVPGIIMQLILFVALSSFLYSLLKRRNQQREQQQKTEQQRDYEEVLDKARNDFIMRSAKELAPLVDQVKGSFEKSKILQTSPQINDVFAQLESLIGRFVLVAELERGKISKSLSSFDIKQNTKNALAEFNQPITDKKLRVSEYLKNIQLHQSQNLLQYVTRILLDNAVKFTPEAGRVSIKSAAQGRHGVALTISNHGEVIDTGKLERLFMPFSRSQSAEVSSDSGVGLSLYLSRLIMGYLGGEIALSSDESGVTTAKVSLPRQAEA
ncbi:MAG: ATP-binding protein, partial [Candidatus Saccharimonadales bacterium]